MSHTYGVTHITHIMCHTNVTHLQHTCKSHTNVAHAWCVTHVTHMVCLIDITHLDITHLDITHLVCHTNVTHLQRVTHDVSIQAIWCFKHVTLIMCHTHHTLITCHTRHTLMVCHTCYTHLRPFCGCMRFDQYMYVNIPSAGVYAVMRGFT